MSSITRKHQAWLLTAFSAAACLSPLTAEARCIEGRTSPCVGPNACRGERTCTGGRISACICEPAPVPCNGRCGRQSIVVNNVCRPLGEICNGCDDDGNGAIDDGISCLGTGPFTPRCVATPADETLPLSLGTWGNGLPPDMNNITRYANAIDYVARVHTNPLVSTLTLGIAGRDVAPNDLFFSRNRSNGELRDLNGLTAQQQFSYVLAGGGQGGGVELHFRTDNIFNGLGWFIEGAKVACGTMSSNGAGVLEEDGADTYGLLTTTDDVVFFQIPPGTGPFSVWLDAFEGGDPTAPFDADIYARWNQLPERNAFDFSSKNTGHGDEWFAVDSPQPGATLFIAVHSRVGRGGFSLRFGRSAPGQRWTSGLGPAERSLRVQTSFMPNATQLAQIQDMLAGGQRFMMAATEGKVQLRNIQLFVRAGDCTCDGQGCDVCVRGISGRAFCQGSMATLFSDEWASTSAAGRFSGGRTFVHELGHCVLGLDDEYIDHGWGFDACLHGDDRCGSTVMDTHTWVANFCNANDHRRNTGRHVCSSCPVFRPGCLTESCNTCPMPGAESDWEQLVRTGKVLTRPTGTANHASYENFRGFPFTISIR